MLNCGVNLSPLYGKALLRSCLLPAIVLCAMTSVAVGAEKVSYKLEKLEVDPAITAFRDWAVRYGNANNSIRTTITPEGVQLTDKYRVAMKKLVREDPKLALSAAIPPALQNELPPTVTERIEKHVVGNGFYGVLVICHHSPEEINSGSHDASQHEIRREVTLNDKLYRASVYGHRLEHQSEEDAPLYGVAIGGYIALADVGPYLRSQGNGHFFVAAKGKLKSFPSEAEAANYAASVSKMPTNVR